MSTVQATQGDLKPKEKRPRLSRSSSIDKMNAFMCSKNYYYFLNALLCWLKNSQTILQRSVEATITQTKKIVGDKFVKPSLTLLLTNLVQYEKFTKMSLKNITNKAMDCYTEEVKVKIERLLAYLAVFTIMAHFVVLIYMTSVISPPIGMMFLLTSIYLITYAQLQILVFYWFKKPKIEENKRLSRERMRRGEPTLKEKRKSILGNRTISNLQFF